MTKGLSPIRAIRRNCLDCSETPKVVLWCPCDGVHSSRCELWPYRFGVRPATILERYGRGLVTPELMPPANVELDQLPGTMAAAAAYLAQCAQREGEESRPDRGIATNPV